MIPSESRFNARMQDILVNDAEREKFKDFIRTARPMLRGAQRAFYIWEKVHKMQANGDATDTPPGLIQKMEEQSIEERYHDLTVEANRTTVLNYCCNFLEGSVHTRYINHHARRQHGKCCPGPSQ